MFRKSSPIRIPDITPFQSLGLTIFVRKRIFIPDRSHTKLGQPRWLLSAQPQELYLQALSRNVIIKSESRLTRYHFCKEARCQTPRLSHRRICRILYLLLPPAIGREIGTTVLKLRTTMASLAGVERWRWSRGSITETRGWPRGCRISKAPRQE